MKRLTWFATCLVATLGCDNATGPKPQLTYEFGRVTALIDERLWWSSYFPDSLVGFYDTLTARLQIIGQEVRPHGIWPTLLLVIPQGATQATYALADSSSGRIGIWTAGIREAYTSAGASGDSLWIEQLDVPGHQVRGSFRFLARPLYNQKAALVIGRFEGTLRLTGGQ